MVSPTDLGVGRIPDEVAVDVDVDLLRDVIADFWMGIDGEAGDEIAAGDAVAGGEERALRLDLVRLAIELVVGRIDEVVLDGERVAIVGERRGEGESDSRCGGLGNGDEIACRRRV